MADLPILFSPPMVRGLLREVEQPGAGKTQTRRILKPQPQVFETSPGVLAEVSPVHVEGERRSRIAVGKVLTRQEVRFAKGDRLWVRETVACGACAPGKPSHWAPSFWRREQGTPKNPNGLWYAADDLAPEKPITDRGRWVPGIHMPRWASRLTLTVTDVRVQRLGECSEADALAEGVVQARDHCFIVPGVDHPIKDFGELSRVTAREMYAALWDVINGSGAWLSNPWIVALTFTVERRNIDAARAA